ncbi:MAG: hypothetical protein AAB496_02435 [Patescibacteria group bacterium]
MDIGNLMSKLKELFDLLVILTTKLQILFERFAVVFWGIFSWLFDTILRFTIDLIRLILSYL